MNPHRKGTLLALQALQELPEAKCRFIVHMQASLDEYPQIRDICTRDPRIQVENRTVTAPGLYHRGDVMVYPTVLDGLGLTVPEALASGLPTIATDCPPMSEFVVAGETGWLVTPREYRGRADGYYWAESWCDSAGVAEAMAHALAQGRNIGHWKRRARKYAEEKLDWRRNAGGLGQRLADAAAAKQIGTLAMTADRSLESRALRYSPVPPLRLLMRVACRRLGREDSATGERLIYG
jgi:glycosyltransferase involved in cell wall biosynthesis